MSKTKRKWIVLNYNEPDALRAEDIPYNATLSVKDAIDLSSGSTGLRGPTGIQGFTGIGIQGITGIQGATGIGSGGGSGGATGIQGIEGPQGDPGATGPQGVTGIIGNEGSVGATGPQGITGLTGTIGTVITGDSTYVQFNYTLADGSSITLIQNDASTGIQSFGRAYLFMDDIGFSAGSFVFDSGIYDSMYGPIYSANINENYESASLVVGDYDGYFCVIVDQSLFYFKNNLHVGNVKIFGDIMYRI